MLTIHQMAERTGVTIRALRYYDKIGLLPPGAVSPAGYRLYGPAELERLQQILFFRELEFPLAEIKAILASPAYDRTAALTAQRALLRAKRDRLDGLLRLVEVALKGETTMEMAFTAFDRAGYEEKCRAYAREVKARWGDTAAWRENQERQQSGEETAWGAAQAEAEELIAAFARSRPLPPEHPQVQALTGRWQAHITRHHYCCTRQTLAGLGELYRTDQRFQAYLDQWGTGTAAQMAAAIAVYCGAQEEDASTKK